MPSHPKNKLSVKSELSLKSIRKAINFIEGCVLLLNSHFAPLYRMSFFGFGFK